jgi:hypothetical protein
MKIIDEIREEIQTVISEPSNRDLNLLAALFVGFPGLIGAYLAFWKGSPTGYVWLGVGAALAATRAVRPVFLVVYRLWTGFSVTLGYFVSRILLTVIFFLVIGPTGFIMQRLGKDPMERKMDPKAPTYWKKRDVQGDYSIDRYEKQF